MIDQTTVGHQFLNATFGMTPRIGWQIDPFGHSATQASLMSGALGFDALYFGRADYQACLRSHWFPILMNSTGSNLPTQPLCLPMFLCCTASSSAGNRLHSSRAV